MVCDTAGNRLELVSLIPDRSNADESFGFVHLPGDRATALPSYETYECDFADGRSVRVKTYADPGRAWGMCGADPANHLSVWIDQRKYLSGDIYSACFGGNFLRLFVGEAEVEVCRPGDRDEQSAVSGVPNVECTQDSISNLPIDRREYPLPSDNWPTPGTVLFTTALDNSLCARFAMPMNGIVDDAASAFLYRQPIWHLLSREYIESLEWAEFDFDNDGQVDLVIRVRYADSMGAGDTFYLFRADDRAIRSFIDRRPILDRWAWSVLDATERTLRWGHGLLAQ